jgi:hypothetical protein
VVGGGKKAPVDRLVFAANLAGVFVFAGLVRPVIGT